MAIASDILYITKHLRRIFYLFVNFNNSRIYMWTVLYYCTAKPLPSSQSFSSCSKSHTNHFIHLTCVQRSIRFYLSNRNDHSQTLLKLCTYCSSVIRRPNKSTVQSNNLLQILCTEEKRHTTAIDNYHYYIDLLLLFANDYHRSHKCENNATTQLNSSLSSLLSASNIGKKQTSTTSCHSLVTHKDLTEIKQQNMHLGSYSWLKTRARCQARKVVVKTLGKISLSHFEKHSSSTYLSSSCLVAVVIAFFVCYAPLYVQRLLLAIMNLNLTCIFETDVFANIIAYLYVISGTTYYFGSVVNPILYNVVSNKYRRAFRNLFFCQMNYESKTTSKTPKTLFQLNRPNKRTINYLVKKPETFPQPYVQNHYQLRMNGTIPMVKRPAIPTSKSNSSSMSSQNREQYSPYPQHFNESLAKKCQVYQNSRVSFRRKLLARKMLADNDR